MALFRLTRPLDPEPLLRGEGLYLRPAIPGDYLAWSRLREQSRAFLTPWARDESFAFLIFDATSDDLLGGLTLGGVRRGVAQAATLGYWMGEPHAGKGRMTRAVAAVARFGFTTLRLHRIEAACIPDNAPSMALLQRNGFRREGLARSYLKINDAWRDHVLFALVEGEAARLE